MKQRMPLIALIALVALFLVPYTWVTQYSPPLDYLLNVVFDNQLAHIVGHSLIFALIGSGALLVRPGLRERPIAYIGLILLAAIGQEGLQMIVKTHPNLGDSLGDIAVDLIAAAAVWIFPIRVRTQRAASRQEQPSHDPPAGGRG